MNERKHFIKRWQLANYTGVKRFSFWNVSAKICNFRVPIYKGVPLPWMKWNPSFNDDCWPTILLWKVSLSEKWVLNYTTLRFSFIKSFLSHGWNDTSFADDWWLSLLVWKVSLSEKWMLYYTNLRFPFIKGFSSHEWNETHPSTMTADKLYDCEKFHFPESGR